MLIWEEVKCEKKDVGFLGGRMPPVWRAKVFGGWFVMSLVASPFFYPDPEHLWDGSSAVRVQSEAEG